MSIDFTDDQSTLVLVMAWCRQATSHYLSQCWPRSLRTPYGVTRPQLVNSLAPGRFENNFQNVFFKLISWIDTLSNPCETVLRRMPQNPSDDKSTLVQVMAWCRQATSHYLSQCWPRSLSPYGVARPRWIITLRPRQNCCHFADDIFKCIFLNENAWILLKISSKFVRKVWINNIPVLDQIMAWRRPGDKPFSEPMTVSLLMHICVTLLEWIKLTAIEVRAWVSNSTDPI